MLHASCRQFGHHRKLSDQGGPLFLSRRLAPSEAVIFLKDGLMVQFGGSGFDRFISRASFPGQVLEFWLDSESHVICTAEEFDAILKVPLQTGV